MNKNFLLEISSDLDYEKMVINISFKNDIVAILNQDKGIENIEIKLYASQEEEYWRFSLKEFIEILEKAKKLLIQVNEE